jgi:hypothetical protein
LFSQQIRVHLLADLNPFAVGNGDF